MEKVDIEIIKIALKGFSLKENKLSIKVDYLVENLEKNYEKEYLMFNGEELAKRIINHIKGLEERGNEDDDLFSGVTIFNFVDHERKEEKIAHFFNKLHDRLRAFRSQKNADNYLNEFQELSRKFIDL